MVRWIHALLVIAALGQNTATTGQLRGAVKDPVQAAVSGARVTLTDQRTQIRSTIVTDNQGSYLFPALQPGRYVVEVEGNGFKSAVSPPLELEAGATLTFDASLVLAELGQSVTV